MKIYSSELVDKGRKLTGFDENGIENLIISQDDFDEMPKNKAGSLKFVEKLKEIDIGKNKKWYQFWK